MNNLYTVKQASGPLISLALHDGHFIDEDILAHIGLEEHERFREEDPYTAYMADLPVTQAVVHSSRFMVDLNRPKDKAIYKKEEDAWGLKVWRNEFPKELESILMNYYNEFYEEMGKLIREKIKSYGYFFILDIHSYNHRRQSPKQSSPILGSPEINLGTYYSNPKWQPISKKLLGYLAACKINGKFPDVRENIVFKGGGFSQWVNKMYGDKGSVVSIEFKKTFMDEWTGRIDLQHLMDIKKALNGAMPMLNYELTEMHK